MVTMAWGEGKYKVTLSVSIGLRPQWHQLKRWLRENSDLSISAYVVNAALLCQQLGIDDPSQADLDGKIITGGSAPKTTETTVTMSQEARNALDKLLL